MAVLIEAISVIVRIDAINQKYAGGMNGFLDVVPNATFCSDGQLVRVGFMDPADVEEFIRNLEMRGLKFMHDGKTVDIAVVDQMRGPTMHSDWLEFGHFPINESGDKVAVCWFYDQPRIAAGMHLPEESMSLATPRGWSYEDSLSASFTFVENGEVNERLKFIRREDDMVVYFDLSTGEEVYLSRTSEDEFNLSKADMSFKTPKFEIKLGKYKGNNVVEIYNAGQPFWENLPGAKKHFRFGENKAKMLLTCLNEIKQFYGTNGYLADKSINQPIKSDKYGKICLILRKEWRGVPYLEIKDITPKEYPTVIGIGRTKSEAIIDLSDEITMFALTGTSTRS